MRLYLFRTKTVKFNVDFSFNLKLGRKTITN